VKVLLAIDDSPFSENATQFLASHYRSSETEIVVLHSTGSLTETDLSYSWAPTLDWEGVQKAEGLVSRAAHTLSQAGFKVTTRVQGGDPRVKIVESANLWPADLVVVGSHGRTGLKRLFLGSVSESVAWTAPCSVAIVRMNDGATRSEASRAETGVRILLAVDDSARFSEAAVRAIIQQFRPGKVQVCIMHVIEQQLLTTEAEMSVRLAHGEELVARARRILGEAGFEALTRVEDGDPRIRITDYAANSKADLIVVSSHGKTNLDRLLIGSVSEYVARHSYCSVEVVRPTAVIACVRSLAAAVAPATSAATP
jgi:nucleotide-binding universal stress UspA family protein